MSNETLPAPLVAPDVDVSGLDGFMLDVQRLFASELWALSTGAEFKAALGLWGRAWQQSPPGSLPNDERVLSSFSGAGRDWKKVRSMALRGFVECSDGRLYHRVLCEDVLNAHRKRQAFRERTKNATEARRRGPNQRHDQRDDERNDGRDGQRNDAVDEHITSVQGQGQGQGQKEEKNAAGPPLRDGNADPGSAAVVPTPQAELYRRGKDILGGSAGGLVRRLLAAKADNVAHARAALEMASQANDPREYIGAIIAGRDRDSAQLSARDRGEAW